MGDLYALSFDTCVVGAFLGVWEDLTGLGGVCVDLRVMGA